MKKFLVLICAGLLLLCGCAKKPAADLYIGDVVYEKFTTKSLSGDIVNESVLQGNTLTMVNVWGTFCGPCIREMPGIEKVYQKYKSQGFNVVGLICDGTDREFNILYDKRVTAEKIVEQTGVTYTSLFYSKDMVTTVVPDFETVPATYFVNKEGKLVGSFVMGAKTEEYWMKIVKEYLDALK